MNIQLIFRKLLRIPQREYKELYRKYSDADRVLTEHISSIKPYQPLTKIVHYQEENKQAIHKSVSLYSLFIPPVQPKSNKTHEERIKVMGLDADLYYTILTLCQRAEMAYIEGELSSSKAIMDSLEEIQFPLKAKALQDYVKKLQMIIK